MVMCRSSKSGGPETSNGFPDEPPRKNKLLVPLRPAVWRFQGMAAGAA
jgi:hypothetical protein